MRSIWARGQVDVALTEPRGECYSTRPSREGRCGRPAIVVKTPSATDPLTAVRDARGAHRSADSAEGPPERRRDLINRRLEASISSRMKSERIARP